MADDEDDAEEDRTGLGAERRRLEASVVRLALGRVPLLSLLPPNDSTAVTSSWVPLTSADGTLLLEALVELQDAQLLRRLQSANKAREAEQMFAEQAAAERVGSSSMMSRGRRRGGAKGGESEADQADQAELCPSVGRRPCSCR